MEGLLNSSAKQVAEGACSFAYFGVLNLLDGIGRGTVTSNLLVGDEP